MDWNSWHEQYEVADSALARRLWVVRARIVEALAEAPAGELKVISLCAGDGRDLLGVLPGHPRREDVRALLVELDPRLSEAGRARAADAGLRGVEVRTGDASLVDHYAELAPAELVLACGVFGNITEADIRRTIGALTQLCAAGGTVIWTRHRRSPDRVPRICEWFEAAGFERRWLSDASEAAGVGVHRFLGEPQPLTRGSRIFEFLGSEALRRAEEASVEAGAQAVPESRGSV
jgi:hypothetical protein